jgi:TRAP-type C4-dicarboxylate transport system permease small subunit
MVKRYERAPGRKNLREFKKLMKECGVELLCKFFKACFHSILWWSWGVLNPPQFHMEADARISDKGMVSIVLRRGCRRKWQIGGMKMNASRGKGGKEKASSEVIRVAAKTAYYGGSGLLLIIMALVTIDVIGRALLNKPLVGSRNLGILPCRGCSSRFGPYRVPGRACGRAFMTAFHRKGQNILRILQPCRNRAYGCLAERSLAIELMKANLTSDVLKIPAWPFRAFVPVGAFLVVLVLFVKLSRDFRELRERRTNKCR